MLQQGQRVRSSPGALEPRPGQEGELWVSWGTVAQETPGHPEQSMAPRAPKPGCRDSVGTVWGHPNCCLSPVSPWASEAGLELKFSFSWHWELCSLSRSVRGSFTPPVLVAKAHPALPCPGLCPAWRGPARGPRPWHSHPCPRSLGKAGDLPFLSPQPTCPVPVPPLSLSLSPRWPGPCLASHPRVPARSQTELLSPV